MRPLVLACSLAACTTNANAGGKLDGFGCNGGSSSSSSSSIPDGIHYVAPTVAVIDGAPQFFAIERDDRGDVAILHSTMTADGPTDPVPLELDMPLPDQLGKLRAFGPGLLEIHGDEAQIVATISGNTAHGIAIGNLADAAFDGTNWFVLQNQYRAPYALRMVRIDAAGTPTTFDVATDLEQYSSTARVLVDPTGAAIVWTMPDRLGKQAAYARRLVDGIPTGDVVKLFGEHRTGKWVAIPGRLQLWIELDHEPRIATLDPGTLAPTVTPTPHAVPDQIVATSDGFATTTNTELVRYDATLAMPIPAGELRGTIAPFGDDLVAIERTSDQLVIHHLAPDDITTVFAEDYTYEGCSAGGPASLLVAFLLPVRRRRQRALRELDQHRR